MNFLQTGRISLGKVALNIITCFEWGVALNTSCTSRRMSVMVRKKGSQIITTVASVILINAHHDVIIFLIIAHHDVIIF